MAARRPISRTRSRRLFVKTAMRSRPINDRPQYRGGIRL